MLLLCQLCGLGEGDVSNYISFTLPIQIQDSGPLQKIKELNLVNDVTEPKKIYFLPIMNLIEWQGHISRFRS